MSHRIDFGSWDSNINPRVQKRLPRTHYGSNHLLDVPFSVSEIDPKGSCVHGSRVYVELKMYQFP